MIHDFQEQLDYSEKASEESFWRAIYKKAFPNMVNCMPARGNTASQRQGIDRIIILGNGEILRIDEKKRRKVWRDFALEYISVDKTGAPGWVEKDLAIDYLAYAFMPIETVYLFPWPILRRAWNHYKNDWKKQYPSIEAQNSHYTTISVCVPIDIVLRAVRCASIIKLGDAT